MLTDSAGDLGVGDSVGARVLQRLKSDTRLAILSVFSVVGSLALAPFAVYRLVHGELGVALLDALLVAAIMGCLTFAWKTGHSLIAGNLVASLLAAGAMFLIPVLGLSYLWLFSLMIAIFLLASSGVSIVLSILLILIIGIAPEMFADRLERLTFFAVAIQVAVFSFVFAWQTSHQHRQLDVMANRDPLTGAGNRRALRRELAARAKAASVSGESAALALIDLDRFKEVNDRHGHDAGDRVLVDLARVAEKTMRSCDSFYRYGGEEFVIVLPGTSQQGIAPAMEKFQAAVRTHLRGPDGVVTVSIGAAGLHAAEDLGTWLSRADRALYAAKSAGRNCIRIDQE